MDWENRNEYIPQTKKLLMREGYGACILLDLDSIPGEVGGSGSQPAMAVCFPCKRRGAEKRENF